MLRAESEPSRGGKLQRPLRGAAACAFFLFLISGTLCFFFLIRRCIWRGRLRMQAAAQEQPTVLGTNCHAGHFIFHVCKVMTADKRGKNNTVDFFFLD